MENIKKKKTRKGLLVGAVIVSLVILLMIRTPLLRFFFASSFLILVLLLTNYLSFPSERSKTYRTMISRASKNWIIYCAAFVSSVSLLFFPAANSSLSNAWMLFASLSISEVIRVASGCFILAIFPGYIACRAFAGNRFHNAFEKVALVIALSYVISVVIGLSLTRTCGLTLGNYLLTLWVFVLACEALSGTLRHKCNSLPIENASDNIKASLIIFACLVLVISSYIITLSADPRGLSLSGDITNYVSDSTAFLRGLPIESPYSWFQVFIGIGSLLTGLHPIYAFVSIQFLMVLFPLSFFTLMVRIFRDNKLASVGTVIAAVTGGLSSLGILNLFQAYTSGNVVDALWTLRTKTQNWPWLSNHFFIVGTMDWSLLMLGLGHIYRFITRKRVGQTRDLVFGSLFLASTYFTHSIIGIIIFLPTIFFFSIFGHKYLRRAILCFLSIFLVTIIFDAISYNTFVDAIANFYLHYEVFFAGSLSFPYQWGFIAILVLLPLLSLAPRMVRIAKSRIEHKEFDTELSMKVLSYTCIVVALVLFILSLVMVFIHFGDLNMPDETIFPWFIYVLRFSPLLQLAVLSIPIMMRMENEKRQGAIFMMSWTISAVVLVGSLNFLFPSFATPLLVNRVLMSIYLPLGGLAALTLIYLANVKLPKVRLKVGSLFNGYHRVYIKDIMVYVMIGTLGFSFLSYAYTIEIFYQGDLSSSMSNEEKDLYNYLGRLRLNKTYLTISYSSYRRISALTMHKTYAYYQYGTFTSWPIEILFRTSSAEIASYFLYKLGITHIVLTQEDSNEISKNSSSSLVLMLNFFPISFNNSFATVYTVPPYLLSESSSYLLIKSTKASSDILPESLINDALKPDNFRIVSGPSTFSFTDGIITQDMKDIQPPTAQHLQLYRGVAVQIDLSPSASFKIRGTGNALFNLGFFDAEKGWYWLTNESGLPSTFLHAQDNWMEITVDLRGLDAGGSMIQAIDFVATSANGSSAEVEWKDFGIFPNTKIDELVANEYTMAYGSLAKDGIRFATAEDYEVSALIPNHVYILSSWINDNTSCNDLLSCVRSGAHVVYIYTHASADEHQRELLDFLGIETQGLSMAQEVCIDNETYLPYDSYVLNLALGRSDYAPQTMSHYVTLDNGTVPMIIRFKVGNGSITFVNWPVSSTLDRALASLAEKALETIIETLPEPVFSTTLKTYRYAEDLFKLGNPTLVNIYDLPNLANYLYVFSELELTGSISITSNYAFLELRNMSVEKIIIQNSTNTQVLESISVKSLNITCQGSVSLETQDATISSLDQETSNVRMPSLKHLKLIMEESPISMTYETGGAERNLSISGGHLDFFFPENSTASLVLKEPVIAIDQGSMNASWEGVFWHMGKIFTTVSRPETWPINGSFSFQIVYCDSVMVVELLHMYTMNVFINTQG